MGLARAVQYPPNYATQMGCHLNGEEFDRKGEIWGRARKNENVERMFIL